MRDKEIVRQIDRYLDGRLTEKEIDLLWEEFLKHPEYLQWLEIEAGAREYFHRKAEKGPGGGASGSVPEARSSSFLPYRNWIYSIAAVAAIFVLLQLLPFPWQNATDRNSGFVSAIPPDEMITSDVFRSGQEDAGRLDVEINRGFEAAMSGRIEESESIFDGIMAGSPTESQLAIASLNRGILFYNSAELESASAAFETAARSEILPVYAREKSWWFLAQTRVRLNDYAAARQAAVRTGEFNGRFSEDAERLLGLLAEKPESR